MVTRVGDTVRDVSLHTVDGGEVSLHDLVDRPTIVQCLRYYG